MRNLMGEMAGLFGTTKITTSTAAIAVSGFQVWSETATVSDIKRRKISEPNGTEYDYPDYDAVEMYRGEILNAGFIGGVECFFSKVVFQSGGRANGFNIEHTINTQRS